MYLITNLSFYLEVEVEVGKNKKGSKRSNTI